MKLNSTLIRQAVSQFDAQAIPENHPVLPQLNRLYGDHTFFLSGKGLHIVEPEPAKSTARGAEAAKVVNIANWEEDADGTSLRPHEPEPTDVVVVLAAEDSDPKGD